MNTILRGNPDAILFTQCLWFLVQCGSDQILISAVPSWVHAHRFSWVSVVHDASEETLCTIVHQLQQRCLGNPAVLSALASVLLVVWSTIAGDQGRMAPPPALLEQIDVRSVVQLMSPHQRDLFVSMCIHNQQYQLWATVMNTDHTVLRHWVTSVMDVDAFGPLCDSIKTLALPDVCVPVHVLQALVSCIQHIHVTSQRFRDPDGQEASDLGECLSALLQLMRKEHAAASGGADVWPSITLCVMTCGPYCTPCIPVI